MSQPNQRWPRSVLMSCAMPPRMPFGRNSTTTIDGESYWDVDEQRHQQQNGEIDQGHRDEGKLLAEEKLDAVNTPPARIAARRGSMAAASPAGSGTPPCTRQTSVLVPPMSKVTASGKPATPTRRSCSRTRPASGASSADHAP